MSVIDECDNVDPLIQNYIDNDDADSLANISLDCLQKFRSLSDPNNTEISLTAINYAFSQRKKKCVLFLQSKHNFQIETYNNDEHATMILSIIMKTSTNDVSKLGIQKNIFYNNIMHWFSHIENLVNRINYGTLLKDVEKIISIEIDITDVPYPHWSVLNLIYNMISYKIQKKYLHGYANSIKDGTMYLIDQYSNEKSYRSRLLEFVMINMYFKNGNVKYIVYDILLLPNQIQEVLNNGDNIRQLYNKIALFSFTRKFLYSDIKLFMDRIGNSLDVPTFSLLLSELYELHTKLNKNYINTLAQLVYMKTDLTYDSLNDIQNNDQEMENFIKSDELTFILYLRAYTTKHAITDVDALDEKYPSISSYIKDIIKNIIIFLKNNRQYSNIVDDEYNFMLFNVIIDHFNVKYKLRGQLTHKLITGKIGTIDENQLRGITISSEIFTKMDEIFDDVSE